MGYIAFLRSVGGRRASSKDLGEPRFNGVVGCVLEYMSAQLANQIGEKRAIGRSVVVETGERLAACDRFLISDVTTELNDICGP